MKLHSLLAGVLLAFSAGVAQATLLPEGWNYFDFRVDSVNQGGGSLIGSAWLQVLNQNDLEGTQSVYGGSNATWQMTDSDYNELYTRRPGYGSTFPFMIFRDGEPVSGSLYFRSGAFSDPILHELRLYPNSGSFHGGAWTSPNDPRVTGDSLYGAGAVGTLVITPHIPDGGSSIALLSAGLLTLRCLAPRR